MNNNEQTGMEHIYVVHGITGYDAREKMLSKVLGDQYRLPFKFITESETDADNEAWISQYFIKDIRNVLSKGPLFCTLVHILIYQLMVQRKEPYAIVFENDVCFLGSFTDKMPLVAKEAAGLAPGFMISLENSTLRFPSWKKTRKGQYLYEASIGRCAGAYMIDLKAAHDILVDLQVNKCSKVIDFWHNDLVARNIIRMYWVHPPLTEQGSFNGKLPSSIAKREKGNIRRIKWQLQKFYKMYILRWFK